MASSLHLLRSSELLLKRIVTQSIKPPQCSFHQNKFKPLHQTEAQLKPKSPNQMLDDHYNKHYNRVRSQNFGPIPIEDSERKTGLYSIPTSLYCERPGEKFGGEKYVDLPIVYVSARWNNTFVTVHSADDKQTLGYASSKTVGFKNKKKVTELAGETVGKVAAEKALLKGAFPYVRVVIKGIGPGRKCSLKGLAAGGFTIVSITDRTPVTIENLPQRPRKIRRL